MTFLNQLEKLRPAGGDKWASLCPVHNNKTNRTLSTKQLPDGSFVCHCFSCGANGQEVFNALGIPLDELFGYKERPRQVITQKQREEYNLDYWVVSIYENAIHVDFNYKDVRRYKFAKARMAGIEQMALGAYR